MRMMISGTGRVLLAFALLGMSGAACAQHKQVARQIREQPDKTEQVIGNWYLSIEKDPFADKKKTIAITQAAGDRGVLAIRCFPDEGLSALVFPKTEKEYDKGAAVDFKYRADQQQIVQDSGHAFGPKGAILPNARQIYKDASKASKLYFRIDTPDGTMADLVFNPKGASRALAQIGADCPEPPAPAPEKEESDTSGKPSKL